MGIPPAQEPADEPSTEIVNEGGQLSNRPGPLPSDAFRSDPEVGIRYRDIFRDTRSPFRQSGQAELDSPLTGSFQSEIGWGGPITGFRANVGAREPIPFRGVEAIQTSFDLMGLRLGYGLSGSHSFNLLGRGFEPNDADLKAGPLYFKLRSLGSSLLISDNVNATETDRESGAIAIAHLSGTIVAQLTESLRLAASGTLYWLPFKGKVGVTTSSGYFDLGFGGADANAPIAQIDWEGKLGEWDVFLTDSFTGDLSGGLFSNYRFDESLFQGESFTDFDQAGRYRYGGASTVNVRDTEFTGDNRNEGLDVIDYSNRLDIGAERLYPGSVRLRLHAYREDLWYNQGNRGRPSMREGASVFVGSERENLRFKPYARYSVEHTDTEPDWDQTIIAGIRGPITDQLFLNFYAGEFIDGSTDRTEFIAGLNLHHVAGPYTYESLFIGREIDDYYSRSEVVDRITYTIHQVLGPRLFGDAFASYEETGTLDSSDDSRTEFRAGLRLSLIPGPRTTVRLSYNYERILSGSPSFLFSGDDRFDDANHDGETEYVSNTIRLDIGYRFTDTLRARLYYQYRNVDANQSGLSYYENLVVLSLSKYFY